MIRVCLYLTIPSADEDRLLEFSTFSRAKRVARRCIDAMKWTILNDYSINYWAWQNRFRSNKGDSIIRESIKQQIINAFDPSSIGFIELRWGCLSYDVVEMLNDSCDVFVIAGGGYFFLDQDGLLPDRLRKDLIALTRLRCLKIAYGVGINQLSRADQTTLDPAKVPSESQSLINKIVGQMDLISVRDEGLKAVLNPELHNRVYVTGDPALFYRSRHATRDIVKSTRRGKSIINVSVNFALHGRQTAENMSVDFKAYAQFLRVLAREYPIKYHYIKHSETERMVPLMLFLRGVRVRSHDVRAEDLCAIYSGNDLNICQMLHSSILSLNADVPTLCVAYDVKSYLFFELMGVSEYCLKRSPLELRKALALARMALDHGDTYRDIMRLRKSQLREVLRTFIEKLVLAIKDRGIAI